MAQKNPSITYLLIGLIWVSFFAAVFGLFLANATTEYGAEAADIDLDNYNKLTELNAQAESFRNKSQITERAELTDIVGGYFSSGYKVMSSTLGSVSIFYSLGDQAFSDIVFIPAGEHLKQAIFASMIIFLVLGVLISAIMKTGKGPI
ncbi:hypothetical protein KJ662_05680 [Patescibacteria group bacterium]|nr:hypothetical protein [Patescibacteria group bacterium]